MSYNEKADQAKSILDSEMWQNTVQALETEAYKRFCNSLPDESEERERIYLEVQGMKRFEARLKRHLDNQKLARKGLLKEHK